MHSWKILITEKRNTFDTISSFQLQSTSENFTNHDITWVKVTKTQLLYTKAASLW